MSKNIMEEATNLVRVSGTLIDVTFREGKFNDGRPYASATATVRTTQTYGGREETSEYLVDMFASKYTKANTLNKMYENIQQLHTFKTAANVGLDNADHVIIRNGRIREQNYASRSGTVVNNWRINAPFISLGRVQDTGNFRICIYIMDMHEELDREGDPTGRLVIKGGVVTYGGNLDVIEFIVEDPNKVDYISRNWEVNKTVHVEGYIRCTSEEERTVKHSTWGDEVPSFQSRLIKELIVVGGDNEVLPDELGYETADIKKAFNVRKAKIEQMQIDAQNKMTAAPKKESTSEINWEY